MNEEEVGVMRNTVGTHRNDDSWKTCPTNITIILSINKQLRQESMIRPSSTFQ